MTRPFIIAEIAQGYEGSQKLVELFVRAAAAVKADAVKFQIFYADELALPDYKYYQLFKTLEISYDVWGEAVKQAHAKGMEFYSDVFGTDSLASLEKIGVDGYKVHTTDINNIGLLQLVAATKKKVFLSTGGCQMAEIDRAVGILSNSPLTLMYGFQAEPTEMEDNNLGRVATLKNRYNKPIGFQDHSAGDSESALYLPFVALGAGVDVIEKHLTLSRAAEIEDYISALTPEEFMKWASLIRVVYKALGKGEWELTEKEKLYRGKVRRAVCAARDIGGGETLKENDLVLKRTDNQNAIFDLGEVAGRRTARPVKRNSAIEKGDMK